MDPIFLIERNIHGAIGVRQYPLYTKEQAERTYRDEVKRRIFVNQ